MSRGITPVDQETFSAAQAAELSHWQARANDPDSVRHELEEHAELQRPLREIVGESIFKRGLEVGVGSFSLGFLAVHLANHDVIQ